MATPSKRDSSFKEQRKAHEASEGITLATAIARPSFPFKDNMDIPLPPLPVEDTPAPFGRATSLKKTAATTSSTYMPVDDAPLPAPNFSRALSLKNGTAARTSTTSTSNNVSIPIPNFARASSLKTAAATRISATMDAQDIYTTGHNINCTTSVKQATTANNAAMKVSQDTPNFTSIPGRYTSFKEYCSDKAMPRLPIEGELLPAIAYKPPTSPTKTTTIPVPSLPIEDTPTPATNFDMIIGPPTESEEHGRALVHQQRTDMTQKNSKSPFKRHGTNTSKSSKSSKTPKLEHLSAIPVPLFVGKFKEKMRSKKSQGNLKLTNIIVVDKPLPTRRMDSSEPATPNFMTMPLPSPRLASGMIMSNGPEILTPARAGTYSFVRKPLIVSAAKTYASMRGRIVDTPTAMRVEPMFAVAATPVVARPVSTPTVAAAIIKEQDEATPAGLEVRFARIEQALDTAVETLSIPQTDISTRLTCLEDRFSRFEAKLASLTAVASRIEEALSRVETKAREAEARDKHEAAFGGGRYPGEPKDLLAMPPARGRRPTLERWVTMPGARGEVGEPVGGTAVEEEAERDRKVWFAGASRAEAM
jgi:hypothetical protein